MESAVNFYDRVLKKLLKNQTLFSNEKILIVAAGALDKETFEINGFTNVLISNIEKDRGVQDYGSYNWEYQDLENLSYNDDEFDWVFVHAGLHHCASPHRGLCEMMRVAKIGVGVFESRDSCVSRIAIRSGLVPVYELEPCVLSNGKDGGLRNSDIPNFVYRWTEREVIKTVNSFLPQYIHKYSFFYGFRIPTQRLSMSPNPLARMIGYFANLISPILQVLIPKQGNEFAFIVSKTGQFQPWIKNVNGIPGFNMNYIEGRFNPEKYKAE